jgi:phosphoglucomutase
VIATDPDADRMGMAVKTEDGYQFLTGNQLGAIFVDYLIRKKQAQHDDLNKYRLIKTIVTSDFGRTIAAIHGIKTIETLTGFKFIGEQADKIEAAQDGSQFFLGYEESFGFLVAPFVRDKDSIQAAVLASEVALDAKRKGQTLPQILHQLEVQYGYFEDTLLSDEFHSKAEEDTILKRVNNLRQQQPSAIAGLPVSAYEDYQKGQRVETANGQQSKLTLPTANVLKIIFKDGSWLAVRPSGTEPKIKTYIAARGNSAADAATVLTQLTKYVQHSLYEKNAK